MLFGRGRQLKVKFPETVDAVYTWVDGDDPEYGRKRDLCVLKKGVKINPERDRDKLELLKYSLRGLNEYAPWINKIFLVTARPQIPKWLDTDTRHSKLAIIHHDEIFLNQKNLPSFNSHAIELHLKNIPGLSDYFLYFNDDYFIGRNVSIRDFINEQGRIIFYLQKEYSIPAELKETASHQYAKIIANTNAYLDKKFGRQRQRRHHRHCPMLFIKDVLRYDNDPYMQHTMSNQFRHHTDIALEYYYLYYIQTLPKYSGGIAPLWKVYLKTMFHRILNEYWKQYWKLKCIQWYRPKFFCLNDDMGDKPDPRIENLVKHFLESYYPKKSIFET